MSSQAVNLVVISLGNAVKRLCCHCCRNVCCFHQVHCVPEYIDSDCCHHLCTVVKSKSFLCSKHDRSNSLFGHSLCRRNCLSLVFNFAKPYKGQRYVGQRRKVSRRSKGAFFGNNRVYPYIEHIYHSLYSFKSDT